MFRFMIPPQFIPVLCSRMGSPIFAVLLLLAVVDE